MSAQGPKTVALAALRRALEEAGRSDGSMLVMGALLTDAARAVEQIAELQRVRKPKAVPPPVDAEFDEPLPVTWTGAAAKEST